MGEPFLGPSIDPGGDSNSFLAREMRILRDRQAAHKDALDRATASSPAFSSARMLVQVYNGGSMPNAIPRVYYTHPVVATGSEIGGRRTTLSTDTVTTVPVIFLNHVPAVGDYATAYAVEGAVGDRGDAFERRWIGNLLTLRPARIESHHLLDEPAHRQRLGHAHVHDIAAGLVGGLRRQRTVVQAPVHSRRYRVTSHLLHGWRMPRWNESVLLESPVEPALLDLELLYVLASQFDVHGRIERMPADLFAR